MIERDHCGRGALRLILGLRPRRLAARPQLLTRM
jgi:hypothetical protein